jgi:hypothetical protein
MLEIEEDRFEQLRYQRWIGNLCENLPKESSHFNGRVFDPCLGEEVAGDIARDARLDKRSKTAAVDHEH